MLPPHEALGIVNPSVDYPIVSEPYQYHLIGIDTFNITRHYPDIIFHIDEMNYNHMLTAWKH